MRFLSEDMTNYDLFCKFGDDCMEELKTSGSCSSNCLNECPSICKIIVVRGISPPPVIILHEDDNLKRILIISASSIITSLFLLTLLVLCFKFYYRRRRSMTISRRWSMEETRNLDFDGPSQPVMIDHPVWHIRTIGLNPTVISSIKVYNYSKRDGLVEGTDCSVCLSEFEEEETLRLLPKCKHAFHLSCIDTWLRSHTNCPLCRAPIVMAKDEGLEEIDVRIQEENGEIERDLEEEERGDDDDELRQRVRRSVSLDSFSGRGNEKVKRGNIGSSIVGRSSFLKRSISYNGKH